MARILIKGQEAQKRAMDLLLQIGVRTLGFKLMPVSRDRTEVINLSGHSMEDLQDRVSFLLERAQMGADDAEIIITK
jgi:hypothetical protein